MTTGEEVAAYVDNNGLGYSIMHGLSPTNFEDKELARLWDVANEALAAVDGYLEQHYTE